VSLVADQLDDLVKVADLAGHADTRTTQGYTSVADHAVILADVPGTDVDSWFIDTMPHRPSEPGEIVWSTLIDLSALD